MADPTIVLLLKIILGLTASCLGCLLLVALVWSLDTVFKTTRSYLMILEWHKAWKRENAKPKAIKPSDDEDEDD